MKLEKKGKDNDCSSYSSSCILSDDDEECNKVDFVIKLLKRINSKVVGNGHGIINNFKSHNKRLIAGFQVLN